MLYRSLGSFAILAAAVVAYIIPAGELAAVPVRKRSLPRFSRSSVDGVGFSTYNLDLSVYKRAAAQPLRPLDIRQYARPLDARQYARPLDARQYARDACEPEPSGSGPVPSPDTAAAFVTYSAFAQAAGTAPQPAHYVQTFGNLNGSIAITEGYLGFSVLDSYSTEQCANLCNEKDDCHAFNIYFERDPSVTPGPECPDPPSTTVIKCAYWSTVILQEGANYTGEVVEDFQIAIAGSNGYITRGAAGYIPGPYNGTFSNEAAVNAPTVCNSYIGYKLFTQGNLFDYNRCAAACEAESAYNIQFKNGKAICRFFNTYILVKNGIPQGQYCALYTRTWDISYATNYGYQYGNDTYTILGSGLFSNETDPGAQTCDAACMSQVPCPANITSSS